MMGKKVSALLYSTILTSLILATYFFLVKPVIEERGREKVRVERVVREEKAKQELVAKQRKQAAQQAKVAAEQVAKLVNMQKLATIGKGEGVEHAFKRQLIYDPSVMNGVKVKIGERQYDLTRYATDESPVKKWAGRTAHILAIVAGYVDKKNGRQIRVKKPGQVAYILEATGIDSEFNVNIYKKVEVASDEFGNKPITSIENLGVDHQATFWADVNGITPFEYLWPVKKAKKQKK